MRALRVSQTQNRKTQRIVRKPKPPPALEPVFDYYTSTKTYAEGTFGTTPLSGSKKAGSAVNSPAKGCHVRIVSLENGKGYATNYYSPVGGIKKYQMSTFYGKNGKVELPPIEKWSRKKSGL